MTRSGSTVFVKDTKEKSSKTEFCEKCKEDRGRIVKLVPYLENDIPSDHFRLCPSCCEIIPIFEVLLESEYEPRAPVLPNNPFDSGTRVSVIRNKRTNKANKVEAIEEIEVPPLAKNMPDEFLEEIVKMDERPVIINYINDLVVEGTDSEDY